MRIAIYHNLPSGGGKRALYEMTRRLNSHHKVDIYTLSSSDREFYDLRPYCQHHVVFPFVPLSSLRSPFGRLNKIIGIINLLRLRNLQRLIANQIDAAGCDVIFVHNCQFSQSPGLLSFIKSPSVYYCGEPPRFLYEPQIPRPYNSSDHRRILNSVDPFPYLYKKIFSKHDVLNVKSASIVLVNSAFSRESLYRAYGIFARVCYLGVDNQRFKPLPLSKDSFVFSVGAVRPNKGFDFLLHSMSLISKELRPRLVIVTNYVIPTEKAYLEELASKLGVMVEFHVLIPEEKLVQYYNQALITLYAPIMEPFGFVPIESMACGTPIVGINEGGIRESVQDKITGLLTERDPKLFAEAVNTLLRDNECRACFGLAGRESVEKNWLWERCIDEIEKHFLIAVQN